MHTLHRFHNGKAARMIRSTMSTITNAKLWVTYKPCDDDLVGDWVIECSYARKCEQRLNRCVNQAIQLALADELDTTHPLVQGIWHIRPENRGRGARFDIPQTNLT